VPGNFVFVELSSRQARGQRQEGKQEGKAREQGKEQGKGPSLLLTFKEPYSYRFQIIL